MRAQFLNIHNLCIALGLKQLLHWFPWGGISLAWDEIDTPWEIRLKSIGPVNRMATNHIQLALYKGNHKKHKGNFWKSVSLKYLSSTTTPPPSANTQGLTYLISLPRFLNILCLKGHCPNLRLNHYNIWVWMGERIIGPIIHN